MKFPGDAWEGAVLEKWIFRRRSPKFSFRGPVCIDIKKTTISNFGAALFYLMFAGLKDLFLDMESIGMKLFCDINVQMLSELSTFDCVPI